MAHQLMLRAGLIRMLMGGVYSYLPLGWKVLGNISNVIRRQMEEAGACELLLPALQPQELWLKSGRDADMGEVMIRFIDRRGRKICLGPTHEEVITELVRTHVSSYKQLPLVLYQIQTKFRDEIRPRFGVVRACEFIMKDAYSFDKDQQGLNANYKAMLEAYNKIFARCGLNVLTVDADPGVMGGKVSHEFMVPAADGEDVVLVCPKCHSVKSFAEGDEGKCPKCGLKPDKVTCIEIGHIFQLGVKYSSVLGANFLDAHGKLNPIIMGCYGIGVSRLMAAVIEQNHDDKGIIWPSELSPYKAIILPLDTSEAKIMENANRIYSGLKDCALEVLLDDRDERPGVKFKDAELIGIPVIIVIGQKNLKEQKVEIKTRKDNQVVLTDISDAVSRIKGILEGHQA